VPRSFVTLQTMTAPILLASCAPARAAPSTPVWPLVSRLMWYVATTSFVDPTDNQPIEKGLRRQSSLDGAWRRRDHAAERDPGSGEAGTRPRSGRNESEAADLLDALLGGAEAITGREAPGRKVTGVCGPETLSTTFRARSRRMQSGR
jgi:hypothetical protein